MKKLKNERVPIKQELWDLVKWIFWGMTAVVVWQAFWFFWGFNS